jgi:hypothetical protein
MSVSAENLRTLMMRMADELVAELNIDLEIQKDVRIAELNDKWAMQVAALEAMVGMLKAEMGKKDESIRMLFHEYETLKMSHETLKMNYVQTAHAYKQLETAHTNTVNFFQNYMKGVSAVNLQNYSEVAFYKGKIAELETNRASPSYGAMAQNFWGADPQPLSPTSLTQRPPGSA